MCSGVKLPTSCVLNECFFPPDSEEESFFCPSVSLGFWFRAGNCCVVSLQNWCDINWAFVWIMRLNSACFSCRASHSCWGDSLKEMVCVDSSGPMNILAERLLKGAQTNTLDLFFSVLLSNSSSDNLSIFVFCWAGDNERAEPHIKQVYFRQFLPVSPKVRPCLFLN